MSSSPAPSTPASTAASEVPSATPKAAHKPSKLKARKQPDQPGFFPYPPPGQMRDVPMGPRSMDFSQPFRPGPIQIPDSPATIVDLADPTALFHAPLPEEGFTWISPPCRHLGYWVRVIPNTNQLEFRHSDGDWPPAKYTEHCHCSLEKATSYHLEPITIYRIKTFPQ